ncbi:MAG: hypothetical protein II987_03615 [Clostridia bacterium]|nr:hypothetical protein [Clostridia bacterium]
MENIIRKPDDMRIICEEQTSDAKAEITVSESSILVQVCAQSARIKRIVLRWKFSTRTPVRIMGDKWERAYGDMTWGSLNGEIFMPWYFLASDGNATAGYGVKTGANSFVCFQYDAQGITCHIDLRNGGKGVCLNGRVITACEIVYKKYCGISEFEAAKQFCAVMCEDPVLPKEPVYGSNNWYYAYGVSSKEDIIKDGELVASLTKGLANRPYMVIDDGWSVNSCGGPWYPNEKYGDMQKIAETFTQMDIKSGIWFRPLHDIEEETAHPERCINRTENRFLDPTRPEVKEYIKETVSRFVSWGYKLIKHDYSTFDLFGRYGFSLNGMITSDGDWQFYDNTKTNAEIVKDLYLLIQQQAKDGVVIGCNTVSHLCAGIHPVNRVGDDTSGRHWSRTRALGINSLAFRLCQNNTFYSADADCVGILEKNIPWSLNKKWLYLLAYSGTPLFVSIQPKAVTEEMKKDLIKAFEINSVQQNKIAPLDWTYNNTPCIWDIDGKKTEFDFTENVYPALLDFNTQPY